MNSSDLRILIHYLKHQSKGVLSLNIELAEVILAIFLYSIFPLRYRLDIFVIKENNFPVNF